MRIGMISDIHIDINKNIDIFGELEAAVYKKDVDILLIAGDICENSDKTLEFIRRFNENEHIMTYFVPGNHDMWDIGGDFEKGDTNKVYEKYKSSPYCLSSHDLEINENWYAIGDIGWYDYSFGSPLFRFEEFESMSYEKRIWLDHVNADWGISNHELTQRMYTQLEQRLEKIKDKNIIMVTHMLTHPYFKVQRSGTWDYFNAFLGSRSFKYLCDKYRVKISLMGHVHYRKACIDNNTLYVCSCLNYYSEWKEKDIKKQVEDALYTIDVF